MKIAAVFLVFLLLAASAAVQAQFSYTTNADGITLTITGYAGTPSVGPVNIPPGIDGLRVVNIADGAFGGTTDTNGPVISLSYDDYPTSATIPDGVTNIGASAFSFCDNLTSVVIPDSVLTIGEAAFRKSGLTSITIPSNVVSLGEAQFTGCFELTNVTISSAGIIIGDGMFAGCGRLTNVVIPSGATSIGTSAFYGCALTNLVIPSGVTNIGGFAFANCPLTAITIPNGVKSIGEAAFASCGSLSSLVIPAGTSNIGGTAFDGCNSLTRILFLGNAPTVVDPGGTLDLNSNNVTVYYTLGTSGWDAFASEQGVPVVLWNPQIEVSDGMFGIKNGGFGFDVSGAANIPVALEAANDLSKANWVLVQSLTLTNGLAYFSDSQRTNNAARFYRTSWP